MGQGQREWDLSERVCSLSKRICYQFDLGRDCARPSDATTVDTPDAIVQENSSNGRFQYGRCVSIVSHCEEPFIPGRHVILEL